MRKRYLVFIKQKGSDKIFNGSIPLRYFKTKEEAVAVIPESWGNTEIEKIYVQEVHLGSMEEFPLCQK